VVGVPGVTERPGAWPSEGFCGKEGAAAKAALSGCLLRANQFHGADPLWQPVNPNRITATIAQRVLQSRMTNALVMGPGRRAAGL
jgi:hypothetical protein